MNNVIRKSKLFLSVLLIAAMLTTESYPVVAGEAVTADSACSVEAFTEDSACAVEPGSESDSVEEQVEDEEAVSEAETADLADDTSADDEAEPSEPEAVEPTEDVRFFTYDDNDTDDTWEDDTSLITLKSGTYVRWIDRIEIPQFGYDLYEALEEGCDNDGVNDFLIEDVYFSENPPAGSNVIYRYGSNLLRMGGSSEFPREEYDRAVYGVVLAVMGAFKHDHPEVFWLGNGTSLSGGWGGDDYYLMLGYRDDDNNQTFDIRHEDYASEAVIKSEISALNGYVDAILSDKNYHPDGGNADKIRFFSTWLENHNEYNTTPDPRFINWAHICLSALKGCKGTEGPTCAGYSKAFKVLCDRTGVPCVLVTGDAKDYPSMKPAGHMWNSVRINNSWYGLDVTYNDMYSSYKKDNYFLVGSETIIKNPRGSMKFADARIVNNNPVNGSAVDFLNGPVLDTDKFDYQNDVEFKYSGTTGDLTWEFIESEKKLVISGDGRMEDYDADEGRTSPWYCHKAGIKSIVIGNGVKHIGDDAFYECSALESVSFDGSVETIGTAAFQKCSRLSEIEIPDTVKTIGAYAFSGCSSLRAFKLPVSVQEIGGYAFAGAGIRDIHYAGTSEQWNEITISGEQAIGDDVSIHCADKTFYYNITVAESVTINGPAELSVPEGDKVKLSCAIQPEQAYVASVTWTSSDAAVAGVERGTGIVTAHKAGTATVTVTVKTMNDVNFTASCTVTVKDEELTDALYPTKITLSNKVSKIVAGQGSDKKITVAKAEFAPAGVAPEILNKTEVVVLDKNASKTEYIKAELSNNEILLSSGKNAPAGKYTIKIIAYAPKSAGQVVATMPLTVFSPITGFGMSNWNPRVEYKGTALTYTIKPVFYGPDNSKPKFQKAVYEAIEGSDYVDGEIKNGKVKIKAGISLEDGDKHIYVKIKADDYSENNTSAVVHIRLTKADGELGDIQFKGEKIAGKTFTMLELNGKRLSLSNGNYDVSWGPAWKNNNTNYVSDRYVYLRKPGNMTITAAAADGSKNKTTAKIKIIYPKNPKYTLSTQNDSGLIRCEVFDRATGDPAPAWLYGYTVKVSGGKIISSKNTISQEGVLLVKPTKSNVTVKVGNRSFSIKDVTTGSTPKVKLSNINGDTKAKTMCMVKEYNGMDMHQYITCSVDGTFTGVEVKEAGTLSYLAGTLSSDGKLKLDVVPNKVGTAVIYVTLINADGKRSNPAELKIKIKKAPVYKVKPASYTIKDGISTKPVSVQGKLVVKNENETVSVSNISSLKLCNAVLLDSGRVNRFAQYFVLDENGFIKLREGMQLPTDTGDMIGYVVYSYADANNRIRTNKDKVSLKVK